MRPPWIAVLGLALLAQLASAQTGDALARAEQKVGEGDVAGALALLDAHLVEAPRDARALRRSAQLLWFLQRAADAINRYDRLLVLGPLPADAARERADYLAQALRPRQARDSYAQIVAADPGDRLARLGLARACNTLHQYGCTRREARAVLQQKSDDVEALDVLAQSYHWTPDAAYARRFYERALLADPNDFAAGLGLSQLDANTDPAAARARLGALMERHPNNPWLMDLDKAMRKEGTAVSFAIDSLSSDAVDIDTAVLQARRRLGAGRELELTAVSNASSYGGPDAPTGKIKGLGLRYSMPVGHAQRVDGRAGVGFREDASGESDEVPLFEAGWSWGHGRVWQGRLFASREPYQYGLGDLTHALDISSGGLSTEYHLRGGLVLEGSGSLASVDPKEGDSVSRWSASGGLRRTFSLGPVPVSTGYTFSRTNHDGPVAGVGYFAPRRFLSHGVYASVHAAIPPRLTGRRLQIVATGRYGWNHYDAVEDRGITGTLGLFLHVGNGLGVFASGTRSDGSLQVGFPSATSTEWRLGLTFDPSDR